MKQEIEKKYLLRENGIGYETYAVPSLFPGRGIKIKQGYLQKQDLDALCAEIQYKPEFEVNEARLRQEGLDFIFTLKGKGDIQRDEENIALSYVLFEKYWPKTEGARVEKVRVRPSERREVEIDVYTDRDLVIAEIEVPTLEEAKKLVPLGKDVTEDERYKNRNLAR